MKGMIKKVIKKELKYNQYLVLVKDTKEEKVLNVFLRQNPDLLDVGTIVDLEPNGEYINYKGICKDQVDFSNVDTIVRTKEERGYIFGLAVKAVYCYYANSPSRLPSKEKAVEDIKLWFEIIAKARRELL